MSIYLIDVHVLLFLFHIPSLSTGAGTREGMLISFVFIAGDLISRAFFRMFSYAEVQKTYCCQRIGLFFLTVGPIGGSANVLTWAVSLVQAMKYMLILVVYINNFHTTGGFSTFSVNKH